MGKQSTGEDCRKTTHNKDSADIPPIVVKPEKCKYCGNSEKIVWSEENEAWGCNSCWRWLTPITFKCRRCGEKVKKEQLMLVGCEKCGGDNGSSDYSIFEAKFGRGRRRLNGVIS